MFHILRVVSKKGAVVWKETALVKWEDGGWGIQKAGNISCLLLPPCMLLKPSTKLIWAGLSWHHWQCTTKGTEQIWQCRFMFTVLWLRRLSFAGYPLESNICVWSEVWQSAYALSVTFLLMSDMICSCSFVSPIPDFIYNIGPNWFTVRSCTQ